MKMLLIAALLALSGCAELKKGYVRVDFMDGRMADFMLCRMWIDREGDTQAQCRDLDTVAKELREQEQSKKKPGAGVGEL